MLALYAPGCQKECKIFDKVAKIYRNENHVSKKVYCNEMQKASNYIIFVSQIVLAKIDVTKAPKFAEQ